MKAHLVNPNLRFALCLLCLLETGCGSRNLPSPLDGNWVTTLSMPKAPDSFAVQASFAMSGHYDSAVGVARLNGLPCASPNTPVSVTATQDLLALQTKWTTPLSANTTLNLNGVQSQDLSKINGTFSLSGTTCGGVTAGNFTAEKYMPLSGSYLGSLVTPQGNPIVFLTSIEQSSTADNSGRYPISGSASITPTQCMSNPTLVSSYVFGNTFSNIYVGTDMSQLNVTGTFSADAKTMNVESFAISGGACNGMQAVGTLTSAAQP